MIRGLGAVLAMALIGGGCAPPGAAAAGASADPTVAGISVLTLNIWHDQQDWPARQGAIAAAVGAADPDVICLQEVLQHAELPNQARSLAARLGYRAYFVSWDSAGSSRRYGNAILTRAPVTDSGFGLLDPADDYRVVAHVRVDRGIPVDVYCTHLHHTAEGAAIRRQQAEGVLELVEDTRSGGPVVVAGDFNARVRDPELGAMLARFTDAFGAVHGSAADAVTTLNTALGHEPRRIDHVLFAPGAETTLVPREARLLLDEPLDGVWGSDHFGVLVRFVLASTTSTPPEPGTSGPAGARFE